MADDLGHREEVLVPTGDEVVDHGRGQRAEDVEHRAAGRALGDVRDEPRDALFATGEGQVHLRREVIEDRLLRHVGGGGDLGDGDVLEPALGEQPAGGGGNRLPRDPLLAGAEAFDLCA